MTPKEGNEMTDGERLARFEERLDNIVKGMEKINDNIEKFTSTFVPRSETELMFNASDKEIESIKETLHDMEQNKWSIRRLWPAWIAVLISLFSWLFNNKTRRVSSMAKVQAIDCATQLSAVQIESLKVADIKTVERYLVDQLSWKALTKKRHKHYLMQVLRLLA